MTDVKRILVTGASGFFGNSFLDLAGQLNQGDHLICVYFLHKQHSASQKAIEWVKADLKDPAQSKKLIEVHRPTHLIHLAWEVPPQNFWTCSENVDWVFASVNLFKYFCEGGGKHFISTGTMAEYDLTSRPLDERAPVNPQTLYGQAKACTHDLIRKVRDSLKSSSVIQWLRIGYFFGEHEPANKLFSSVATKMISHEPIHAISRDSVRDFGHARYVGTVLWKLLITQYDGALNVSGGTNYTLGTILDHMAERTGFKNTVNYGTYQTPSFEPLQIIPDISRMKGLLSVDPARTFFEDVDEFVDHIRKRTCEPSVI